MGKWRFTSLLLALVVLLNVNLPFIVSITPERSTDKIAICTIDGIKYVSQEELVSGNNSEGKTHVPHCPLCILNDSSYKSLPALGYNTVSYSLQSSEFIFTLDSASLFASRTEVTPLIPRAPPVSLS